MRNLYLLQKTSILDDRVESCSCAKIVPTLYRPVGFCFSETDQLSTVVAKPLKKSLEICVWSIISLLLLYY